jgi:hypothetical protein
MKDQLVEILRELRSRIEERQPFPPPPPGAYEIELLGTGVWHVLVAEGKGLSLLEGPAPLARCRMICHLDDLTRMLTGSSVDIIYSFCYDRVTFSVIRYAPFYPLLLERPNDAQHRNKLILQPWALEGEHVD